MHRLRSLLGDSRLARALTSPVTRTIVRSARTVGLAGTIAYGSYASGVHDALADPEGQTRRILTEVLKAHGGSAKGGPNVLTPDAPDAQLITRLGNELVVAAQHLLSTELAELGNAESDQAQRDKLESKLRALRHNWRFVVIDNDVINAFVTDTLPGFVFVHRGLIELMGRDTEQLSFIIGHELSHHILDHNEQDRHLQGALSLLQLLVFVSIDPTGIVSFLLELGAASTLLSYGVYLPTSRKHESEADALGLQLVTTACRKPGEAIKAHQTLAEYEQRHGAGGSRSTSLGATHPATLKRLEDLQQMVPEAEAQYKKGGCHLRKSQLYRALLGSRYGSR